ncbi:MAG: hypothetical protein H0T55_03295 [Rubrobacteraceae bacterium]|nr:hypothetical protein [Rubrobacteraceae bacterium]
MEDDDFGDDLADEELAARDEFGFDEFGWPPRAVLHAGPALTFGVR